MSLYENINRRKRLGISRPKSKSTVSAKSYANMKAGFPKKNKLKMKKSQGTNIPRQNYKPLTGDSGGAFFMEIGKNGCK